MNNKKSTESIIRNSVLALGALAFLAGCGTVSGFGQDVQGLGKFIQNGATPKPPAPKPAAHS